MSATLLVTIGLMFLSGLAADALGRRTAIPRVSLLLLCGLLIGNSGFALMPDQILEWYGPVSDIALTMVAFLLGGSLSWVSLRSHGATIFWVSFAVVIATFSMVMIGLWVIGVALPLALILGAIATATDPAATQDAIAQTGLKGSFSETLIGVVAIDDAWGMIVFSIAIALAGIMLGGGNPAEALHMAIYDLGGAVVLGALIGFPAAHLTGRLHKGRPLQTEALGLVFLTAGLAQWLEVSFLMAGMTVGAVIVNRAKHHENAFHEIEHIEWPFMILFFILAGASLELSSLAALGWIGAAFIGLRILARVLGGWVGGNLAGRPKVENYWYGAALLPQAGVAVGMALVAAEAFPQWHDKVVSLAIGTTVFFELTGPLITALAVRRVAGRP